MKIGLLLCDHISPILVPTFGDLPEMFRNWLPGTEIEVFPVCDGIFPSGPAACDGWLVSGSRHSVYDEIDWVLWLKNFVREVRAAGTPFVGVCFGHQMLGEALGGRTRPAPGGWCVGLHEFEIKKTENWMLPSRKSVNVLMMCRDQVLETPPETVVLASEPNCPHAIIRVGENMLGIQGHPEFPKAYNKVLMEIRAEKIGADTVREGIKSLEKKVDSAVLAAWVLQFFASRMA